MKKIYKLIEDNGTGESEVERFFSSRKKAKKFVKREIKNLQTHYIRYYQGFGDQEIKDVPQPGEWEKNRGFEYLNFWTYTFVIEKIYLNEHHQ